MDQRILDQRKRGYYNIEINEVHLQEYETLKSLIKGKSIEEIKKMGNIGIYTFNDCTEYVDIDYKHIVGTIYKNEGRPYLDSHFDIYTLDEGYEDHEPSEILGEPFYFLD